MVQMATPVVVLKFNRTRLINIWCRMVEPIDLFRSTPNRTMSKIILENQATSMLSWWSHDWTRTLLCLLVFCPIIQKELDRKIYFSKKLVSTKEYRGAPDSKHNHQLTLLEHWIFQVKSHRIIPSWTAYSFVCANRCFLPGNQRATDDGGHNTSFGEQFWEFKAFQARHYSYNV